MINAFSPSPQPSPSRERGLKRLHIPHQLIQHHAPPLVEAHLLMLLTDFLRRMTRNRRVAGFALPNVLQQQDRRHKRLFGRLPALGITVGKDQLVPRVDFKKHAPVIHPLPIHLKYGIEPPTHAQIEVAVDHLMRCRDEEVFDVVRRGPAEPQQVARCIHHALQF